MKKIALLLLLPLLLVQCRKEESKENYLILVSFDGCRWDYPDLYSTPNMDLMAEEGVKAERVISSFPTKTFPNHYTIATGLYPDHHGLINNTFYAEDLDKLYRIGNREMVQNPDFYGGEPIWNTAEKQGVKAASFFWVGSEAPVQGMQPSYWKLYDGSVPFSDRVDSVIHWLKLPLEKRPRLVLLYFQEPDWTGHDFGPVHEETGRVMTGLDSILGYLRQEIALLPQAERVNLILTSDHGMGETSSDRYVNLNDHLEGEWVNEIQGGNPVYLLDVKDGFEEVAVQSLDEAEGVTAWLKEDIPGYLHYGSNPRIPDVLIVADSSWSIGLKEDPSGYTGGAHGYDNRNTDMHNIFYAIGPAFKKGYLHSPFENVNIYPLVAHILGLDPAPTDGDLNKVKSMLAEEN